MCTGGQKWLRHKHCAINWALKSLYGAQLAMLGANYTIYILYILYTCKYIYRLYDVQQCHYFMILCPR